MWQRAQSIALILSVVVTGSSYVPWEMAVSPEVTVSRGEDLVLNCSFTHPGQQLYPGAITVKWLARERNAEPFFTCSLKNDSTEKLNDCSGFRYSLAGDPRRGTLSLLIRKVQLTDDGEYFCRVELDQPQKNIQKQTTLHVTSEPQILSLSVVDTPSAPDSAPRRLQCEAEGHPLPKVVWLSASRLLTDDQGEVSQSGPYQVISSVPYLEGAELTCRAENTLGHAERTYPVASHTLMIALVVSGLMVALLLSAGVIVHCCANRAPVDSSPLYGNAEVVLNRRQRAPDSAVDAGADIQLVYSVVGLSSAAAAAPPPVCQLLTPNCPQQEAVVLYSAVSV